MTAKKTYVPLIYLCLIISHSKKPACDQIDLIQLCSECLVQFPPNSDMTFTQEQCHETCNDKGM